MNIDTVSAEQGQASWAMLRNFVRPGPTVERCELCNAALAPEHTHLLDPVARKLLCACDACAILFEHQGARHYRRVRRDVRFLPDFRLTDAQWNALSIPVGLAFFFHSTAAERVVAIYPSPGGPTESLLELGDWSEIVEDNPTLESMEPDTQALLVNRIGPSRECYLAPIDECYRLVGLLRTHWQGFSGGTEVWQEISCFFDELKRRTERA